MRRPRREKERRYDRQQPRAARGSGAGEPCGPAWPAAPAGPRAAVRPGRGGTAARRSPIPAPGAARRARGADGPAVLLRRRPGAPDGPPAPAWRGALARLRGGRGGRLRDGAPPVVRGAARLLLSLDAALAGGEPDRS